MWAGISFLPVLLVFCLYASFEVIAQWCNKCHEFGNFLPVNVSFLKETENEHSLLEPLCWRENVIFAVNCEKENIANYLFGTLNYVRAMCAKKKCFRKIVHMEKCERVLLMTFSYQLSVDEFGISDCFERHLWWGDLINVFVERRYFIDRKLNCCRVFGLPYVIESCLNFICTIL